MIKPLLLLAAILAPMTLAHQSQAQRTLAALVDRNRVLLVFAPSDLDRRFAEQISAFDGHETELNARDLVLIPLLQQVGTASLSPVPRNLRPPLVQADEQITFRHRFHVAPGDFAVVLLGKDGGEKLRSKVPVSLARLNKTIDAMPMRKQEMRSGH